MKKKNILSFEKLEAMNVQTFCLLQQLIHIFTLLHVQING